jgi:hypothetical protein
MPDYADELRWLVECHAPVLLTFDEVRSARRPAPGKWSPREIIGHLIDSASNNHGRFVRARFRDDLVFDGYDQDAWVAAQQYQDAPWAELVGLWRAFNLHLAHVMDVTPEAERLKPRAAHNLDQLAWRALPADRPATLDFFMEDYVEHLKHHLRQIPGLDI